MTHIPENDVPGCRGECWRCGWCPCCTTGRHGCVAAAWDEGFAARAEYDQRRDVPTHWPDLNPYRVIPPARG